MLSLLQGIMSLLVFMKEPASLDCFKTEGTGSVLKTIADIPNELIQSFATGNDFMDVFVPEECLKDNIALFKAYLKSREQPVTLWSDGRMHLSLCKNKMCSTFRRSFFNIVYFICGKYDLEHVWRSVQTDYFMSAFVVASYANHPSQVFATSLRMPFVTPYPRASGRYVISFDNGSLFLTSEFKKKQIEHQTNTRGLLLEKQQKLNGSFMYLACQSTYACQHPSFNVTLKLLAYRNASVRVDLIPDRFQMLSSNFITSLYTDADRDTSSVFTSLHYLGSAGFSFYVRKRGPVLKETIFILPFSCEVWVGFLASCLLLVLTYGLIAKVTLKANVHIFLFVFAMLAAFLQQSAQLHRSLLNRSPSRMLYGIMALMFVVISTAFKGRLTSLLNNLPLEGEGTQFVSFEHLVKTGHRLCILEEPGILAAFGSLMIFKRNGPIKSLYQCYQTSNSVLGSPRSIKTSADGRDTFFTYNSRTGPSEALRRELLERGYVETEGTVFSYPVGPAMRASSVYRDDFDTTLSRAIETGLYERYVALAEYKSRYFRESRLQPTHELVLTSGDLRPFFVAWFVGMSFSVLVFIGEVILSRVGHRNRSDHGRVIPKKPSHRDMRNAGLTKRNRRLLERN